MIIWKILDDGGCEHVFSRDVAHIHPKWMHDRMETSSEQELQAALDRSHPPDFPGPGPENRDCSGLYYEEA
jgi:hypothetical protein